MPASCPFQQVSFLYLDHEVKSFARIVLVTESGLHISRRNVLLYLIEAFINNLAELEIESCYDLKEVPAGLCLTRLIFLDISDCLSINSLPN
ncbi:hypothetical protein QVD17_24852 [Tagetes erecta]|uniref:Uncharacterized protein n=1 Tax=Tagetes erecta TaxID=13708 RepID=A0AAD8KIH3_TARER|nr:hypothetical protein QVD17_24852 [Tagetes erecta]